MQKCFIVFFCTIIFLSWPSSIPAQSKALTAYLFGRSLGQSIVGVVKSGAAYFKSKQQGSIQIAQARKKFWQNYPYGAEREAPESELQQLLTQKDLAYLAIYLPEGISPRSNLLAKLGGHLDKGIPKAARYRYFIWVTSIREFLGARRHYPGNLGEQPDMVVAGPERLLKALTAPAIVKLYDEYKLDRDRAEFVSVNREAEFDSLMRLIQAETKPKIKKVITKIPEFLVDEKHRLRIPPASRAIMLGKDLAAGHGKIVFGGQADGLMIHDVASNKHLGNFASDLVAGRQAFGLSTAISGRYMIIGDPSATRDVAVLRSIIGGQRLVRNRAAAGVAYIYDLETGTKVQTLRPEMPLKKGNGKRINQNYRARFGEAVAIRGPYAIVGAPGEQHGRGSARWGIDGYGAAYIFDIRNGKQIARVVGNKKRGFGFSVAIGRTYAAVGAPGIPVYQEWNPEVRVYSLNTGQNVGSFTLPTPSKGTGFGMFLTFAGEKLMIGAPIRGQTVYAFDMASKNLDFQLTSEGLSPLETSGFGTGIVVREGMACVGAYIESAVYCFDLSTRKAKFVIRKSSFLRQKNQRKQSFFGWSLALVNNVLVIGAHGENWQKGNVVKGNIYRFDLSEAPVKLNNAKMQDAQYKFTRYVPASRVKPKPSIQLNKVIGTWKSKYLCGQMFAGTTFTISGNGPNKVKGSFRFYAIPENPEFPSGEFLLQGRVFHKSGHLMFKLKPSHWVVKPKNFRMHDLSGVLQKDGTLSARLEAPSCRRFIASRTSKRNDIEPRSRAGTTSEPIQKPHNVVIKACKRRAADYRDKSLPITCYCAPGSMVRYSIYGTGVYTSDSGVCPAALHAGKIGTAGGQVTFRFQEGKSNYTGTKSNGVTSKSWNKPWHASFAFQ